MILVTGGCRSGKSEYGEALTAGLGPKRLYIATGKIWDEEMALRVENHRRRRGDLWTTHEGYRHLEALNYSNYDGILLDSVTSMVTNLLFDYLEGRDPDRDPVDYIEGEKQILSELAPFVDKIKSLPAVLVTDEIGLGVVPETPLGRGFRDILGRVNQYLAAEASEVYFVVSGLPVKIKPERQ